MKQRLGAMLCIVTGAVLIAGGLGSGAGGTVGVATPVACGATSQVGAILNPGNCPTGEIDLTETTVVTANPGIDKPLSWQVSVSSVGSTPCNLPASGTTKNVEDGGSVTFSGLFIYTTTDTTDSTTCQYEITEQPVAGFTGVFAPVAPYSFIYVPDIRRDAVRPNALTGVSPLAVTLTNTAAAPSTTAAPSSTPVTSSAAPSTTAAPSSSASLPASASATVVSPSASASGVIANTGPSTPVRGSLVAGIVLVLLGFVLLFAGRRRTRGQHSVA